MPESPSNSSAVDPQNPWPGLASFSEDTQAYFHGRTAEVAELGRRVQRKLLTVLFGQSGLGKTSMLRAGVVPRLRREGYCPVYIRLDYGREAPPPAEQIRLAICATIQPGTPPPPDGETLWEFLHRRGETLHDAAGQPLIPLIVFDQFEEIFTLGQGDEVVRERAATFLEELSDLVENRAPRAVEEKLEKDETAFERFDFSRADYRLLISLREDYLPHLESLKTRMPSVTQNRMRLARMTGTQALEAVIKPGGALVTEEVARAIVEFVSGARGGSAERLAEIDVEPPLLSVICRELNERRRALGQDKITADLVTGNRREILHDFYERSVADLPEKMRMFVEDHLLTKSGFRDNLALETALEHPGVTRPLTDTLVSRRLLRIEDRLGIQRVELTHDVLAEVVRGARDERKQRLERAAAARQVQRQRALIGGLTAVVAALLVGAFFGIRAQRRAERLAREEAAASSHTDFIFGSRLLDEDKTPEGLAFLVRAARSDPGNSAVGSRLVSALAGRSFPVPVGEPLTNPSPIWLAWYAPLGKSYISYGRDDFVRIWNSGSAKVAVEFQEIAATAGNWSADGNQWVLGNQRGVVLNRDLTTGRILLGPLQAHDKPVRYVGTSQDGKWLATGAADQVKIWDLHTGELKASLKVSGTIAGMAFSPDSQRLVTASSMFQTWSVPGGDSLSAPLRPGNNSINWVEFTKDGATLAVLDVGAQFYDGKTLAPVGARMVHPGTNHAAALSVDGTRLVTGSSDGTARIWEVPTGRSLQVLRLGAGVQRLFFTPDARRLLVTSDDEVMRVFDVESGRLAMEPVRAGGVVSGDLHRDGNEFLTAGRDQVMRRWQMAPGQVTPLEWPAVPGRLAVVRPNDGTSLAWAIYTDRMESLDLLTGRTVKTWPFPAKVTLAYLAPDALHLAVRLDPNTAELWKLGDPMTRIPVPLRGTVTAMRFSADSTLLANNTPEGVRVWDTDTGVLMAGPLAGSVEQYALDPFSPDKRRIVLYEGPDVMIYDLTTGKQIGERMNHRQSARSPVFSPDGRLLATATWNGTAQIWDAQTTRPLGSPMVHRNSLRGLKFTRDGKRLLTWARNEARVWDVATTAPLTEWMPGGTDITVASFSEDESMIATYTNTSREVKIWDSRTGHLLAEPFVVVGTSIQNPPTFHQNGRMLATSAGGGLQVWPVPSAAMHGPAPEWLLRLATAEAGGEIDRRAVFRSRPFDPKEFDSIRSELAVLPDQAPFVEWGRWFLADRATRPIAPGFRVTRAEADVVAKTSVAAAKATTP